MAFAQVSHEEPVLYKTGPMCLYEEVSSHVTEIPSDEGVFVGETCVTGARLLGANVPRGNAIDLPVGDMPTVGGVVKLKYGEGIMNHHIAVIKALLPKGMWVAEYNFKGDGQYGERFISYDDPAILGFWSQKNL